MIIRQIKIGRMKVFSYILGCEKTGIAAVIDPAGNINKIIKESNKFNLKIKFIFNTHYHADHTCGNRKLKKLTGAQILIHRNDYEELLNIFDPIKIFLLKLSISPKPDIIIEDERSMIKVGNINIEIIHTPGHSPGSICFYAENNLFTGDTLFVGDSGRTDLKGGNRKVIGESLRMLMKTLPDDTIVWPGHDYGQTKSSTLHWEKLNNRNAKEYCFKIDY
jgi:glyoxylase-like metal-dependent hydrolase (beta-lactamase superfamily II)